MSEDRWCGICGLGPSPATGIGSHHAKADHHEGTAVFLDHPPDREELEIDDVEPFWDREYLYELSVIEGQSAREIAKRIGLPRRTVAYWIKRHDLADGRGHQSVFEQTLASMDPDDIGTAVPEGDDSWKERNERARKKQG